MDRQAERGTVDMGPWNGFAPRGRARNGTLPLIQLKPGEQRRRDRDPGGPPEANANSNPFVGAYLQTWQRVRLGAMLGPVWEIQVTKLLFRRAVLRGRYANIHLRIGLTKRGAFTSRLLTC